MRIFICGQKSFGRAVLARLLEDGHEIVGVAVPPQEKYYDKMQGLAIKQGIETIVNADRLVSKDIPAGTDLIVAAHAHHFISAQTRSKAKHGAIGFHPSLLPRHRGRDAVRWTVAMKDPVAGGTVYILDEVTDGGPVLMQRFIHVDPKWNHHDLWRELFPMGVDMLSTACKILESGAPDTTDQDDRFATWEPSFDAPRLFRPELVRLA